MDDLFKTTEKQKNRLYEIAEAMRLHGVDSVFIENAVKVAEYYEGCFDMFCLWAEESDENERMNILDCLKREIVEFDNDRANFGCLHSDVSLNEVEKKLFDLSFKTESLVCNKCGAILRGKEYEGNFNIWLRENYQNNPEKFKLDCYFPHNIFQAAQEYLKAYPGTSIDSFLKALVVIYLNLVDQYENESISLKSLFESEVSKLLANNEDRRQIDIHVKPKLMIEILAITEVFGVSPSALVEEVIIKLMAAYLSHEPRMRRFWDREVHRYLYFILKAG